ncbi:hypothetical protein FGB62_68g170 [Gracilaria domingensis]|nr:hypothetical protein FGB62_68g170 [Gracilaria domingensis]
MGELRGGRNDERATGLQDVGDGADSGYEAPRRHARAMRRGGVLEERDEGQGHAGAQRLEGTRTLGGGAGGGGCARNVVVRDGGEASARAG